MGKVEPHGLGGLRGEQCILHKLPCGVHKLREICNDSTLLSHPGEMFF